MSCRSKDPEPYFASIANIVTANLLYGQAVERFEGKTVKKATFRKLKHWDNVVKTMEYFEENTINDLRGLLRELQWSWSYNVNALARMGWNDVIKLGQKDVKIEEIMKMMQFERPSVLQGKEFQVFRRAKRLYVRQESNDDGALTIGKTITLEGIIHTSATPDIMQDATGNFQWDTISAKKDLMDSINWYIDHDKRYAGFNERAKAYFQRRVNSFDVVPSDVIRMWSVTKAKHLENRRRSEGNRRRAEENRRRAEENRRRAEENRRRPVYATSDDEDDEEEEEGPVYATSDDEEEEGPVYATRPTGPRPTVNELNPYIANQHPNGFLIAGPMGFDVEHAEGVDRTDPHRGSLMQERISQLAWDVVNGWMPQMKMEDDFMYSLRIIVPGDSKLVPVFAGLKTGLVRYNYQLEFMFPHASMFEIVDVQYDVAPLTPLKIRHVVLKYVGQNEDFRLYDITKRGVQATAHYVNQIYDGGAVEGERRPTWIAVATAAVGIGVVLASSFLQPGA